MFIDSGNHPWHPILTGDSHHDDSFPGLPLRPRRRRPDGSGRVGFPRKAPQNGEAKKPQNGEAKSQPQKATQVPSPHAFSTPRKPQRINGERNGFTVQPGRVEYSYPLKGDQERSKSVKVLQQLTVDLLALHNIYKEAHWDLTGPLFVSLHEYFQQQADFYLQQADLFAERVLHLGAYVDGRFSTVARTTRLAELPEGYLTDDHVAQAPDRSRHRAAEGDLRSDRRDGGERPADGQQAARPGVLG